MGVAVKFTLLISSSRAWTDESEENLSVTNLVLSQLPPKLCVGVIFLSKIVPNCKEMGNFCTANERLYRQHYLHSESQT